MTAVLAGPRFRSYSQLSRYQECPESFRLRYIERIPEQPSVWTVGGTAFHTFAEWFLRGDLGQDPTPEKVRNAWDAAWIIAYDDQLIRHPGIRPADWRAAARGAEDVAWWKANGFQMCLDFADWRRGQGSSLIVLSDEDRAYLEAELNVTLGGINVKAIPDALVVDEHGQVDILDYKTGKPPRESKQLGVYRAAVLEALNLDAVWGLYYMARAARLIPVDLRKYEPEAIGAEFAAFDAAVRASEFTPTPGDPCRFCPYKARHCRAWNQENA